MKLITTLQQSHEENPPLVLIHGLGSAATVFKPIIPALLKDFRVITVDLPGHGQSPFVKGFPMDPQSLGHAIFDSIKSNYGIESFHVAGNSLGGWIALEMAASQPDRILSVTGLAPAGLWLEPATSRSPSEARSYLLAKAFNPLIKTALRIKSLRKIGFETVSPRWQELSYETCYDASMAMTHCKGYFPAWDGMLNRRFDSHIPQRVPVTILFGDTDNTLPLDGSQERSLAPAQAKWLILDSCGHAPMWDHPEAVVRIIKEVTLK